MSKFGQAGAIAVAEAERKEKERLESIAKDRWEQEMALKKRELDLKEKQMQSSFEMMSLLKTIDSKLSNLQDTLSRFENQYFFPFKSVDKHEK